MTGGDDLNDLLRRIKNSPLNPQAVTLPTKSWADYAAEMSQAEETPFDEAAWNERRDTVETEMKAASLAHEETERREPSIMTKYLLDTNHISPPY